MTKFVLLIMAVIGCLGVGATRSALSDQGQGKSNEFAAKNPQEGATLVDEGVLSEIQKEHSRLFSSYSQLSRRNKKLSDYKTKSGNIKYILEREPRFITEETEKASNEQLLKIQACESDAIIVGAAKEKASQLTEDGEFVFTDYKIGVSNVLHNKSSFTIPIGGDILVTRAGGKVLVNGRIIEALDTRYPVFELGKQYLLFLKHNPPSGAFIANIRDGSYLLHGETAVSLSMQGVVAPTSTPLAWTVLLNIIQRNLDSTCNK